jgi:ribosomal protein L35
MNMMNKKEFDKKLIEDRIRDINRKEVVDDRDVKRYKELMLKLSSVS